MILGTRVVFDCNIFLQALASPSGPSGRCVQLAIEGKLNLFISSAVVEEVRAAAYRPRVAAKLRLVADRVEEFLQTIEVAATLLDGFPEVFSYQRDPDDAAYVNLAIAANATFIVSRDNDLLDLMISSRSEAADFRQRFPMLRIVDPLLLLNEIGT